MYLQIYIYHEQQILQLHSFAFHVFMDLLKDCVVSFSLIKSHPTEEMRFVKIGFCGVRIFNVILWCPHF